jgi:two-component system sensor histidine kinase KdpD
MALGEIAHLLDRRRREQREGQDARGTTERVMVCLSSRSPSSEQLLCKAARLAGRLGAPWYAIYVQTPAEEMHRVEAAVQRRISNTLALTQQLGGTPFQYKGADVVSTIAAFAREYGITQILVGRTRQPWYRRWFGPSFLDRLVLAVEGADVVVAGHF